MAADQWIPHKLTTLKSDNGHTIYKCHTCGYLFKVDWTTYTLHLIARGETENVRHYGEIPMSTDAGAQMGEAVVANIEGVIDRYHFEPFDQWAQENIINDQSGHITTKNQQT